MAIEICNNNGRCIDNNNDKCYHVSIVANIITIERKINLNFGDFISAKRKNKNIPLRQMAITLGISAPYLTDIEKDRRNPPEKKLELMATILGLSDEEKIQMWDLAAAKVNAPIPSDLPDYIRENDLAVTFLRKAKDKKYTREDWQKLLESIDEKE